MSTFPLQILAGPDALAELREHGLRPERVRVMIGASGGPKWLALHGLDRVLFPWLLEGAREPVHAIASSIGSWRFACLCARDPLAAIDRFREAYVEQRYRKSPSADEVTAEAERILDLVLGRDGVASIVTNDKVQLHIVTTRFRHVGASEGALQLVGLGIAAVANLLHRRALSISVDRVLFDAQGDSGPFAPWSTLPTHHVPLTSENCRSALLASGAIPRVMRGIRDPHGAPPGVYRDGGIAEYHFGERIDPQDGLALYPHFYPHMIPGWFDKALPHRRSRGLRRLVLIAPSKDWVARLPHGRIPDRADFNRMNDGERVSAWRRTLAMGDELGQAFGEWLASGRLHERVQALA